MAEEKKAKKIYTLEEIKFNRDNLTMAVLACIPLVGFILMFMEKKDLFVRYHATQFAFLNVVYIIWIIPFIGPILASLVGLLSLVLFVLGLLKTSKGERFDIPYLSGFALKVMSEIG